ncbi:MAG: hypothetical protein B6I24_01340 [Bacteroidetes bacterium 4572_128]|nr:MAG: hypothetical protein B6I24_01340 [Bacteroidetes bacterium 4572_128]
MIHTSEERKRIEKKFSKLLTLAKRSQSKENQNIIKKAFKIADEAHKTMRRKSGEPYIFHPIEVAEIIADEIGLGTTSIVCSLLHDVVEDTDYTIEDMENIFNKKVARIIDGLTKIENKIDDTDKNKIISKANTLRKVLMTITEDIRVIFIKLADRLHNMRTLDSMKQMKQIRTSNETLYIYAPLAHRLGLYNIKTELEDLCLKYMRPEIYKKISEKIKDNVEKRSFFIKNFSLPISEELKKRNIKHIVDGRPKSIYSIWTKMQKKKIQIGEVFDILAIRIVFQPKNENIDLQKEECWKIYAIITNKYKPHPDRLRDWISTPKANGYKALHTTIMGPKGKWIEIQIRTEKMNEMAEIGYASHLKYKGYKETEKKLNKWLQQVRMSLENSSTDPLTFLDNFKLNLFASEILVFTPKGEIKTFPKGSTVLDFAFEIHTEIANKSVAAKINKNLVPLNTVLKSGDQIEMITSNKQEPQRNWLSFVKTSKALTSLKSVFKNERKRHIFAGRKLLEERIINELNLKLTTDVFKKILNLYSLKLKDDIYYAIGNGDIDLFDLTENSMRESYTNDKLEDILLVDNLENSSYILAECCKPKLGNNNIISYRGKEKNIIIHKRNCKKVLEDIEKYGENIILNVRWSKKKIHNFLTHIKLEGLDRLGIVNDLTTIISKELGVNMKSIVFRSDNGVFQGEIGLFVKSLKDLENLMQSLEKLDNIKKIIQIYNV